MGFSDSPGRTSLPATSSRTDAYFRRNFYFSFHGDFKFRCRRSQLWKKNLSRSNFKNRFLLLNPDGVLIIRLTLLGGSQWWWGFVLASRSKFVISVWHLRTETLHNDNVLFVMQLAHGEFNWILEWCLKCSKPVTTAYNPLAGHFQGACVSHARHFASESWIHVATDLGKPYMLRKRINSKWW